jgi:hypothetical protein
MSKEYIDREEVILAVRHAWAKGLEPTQYIEQIPAADVVEVVRCEDCIRRGTEGCAMYWDTEDCAMRYGCEYGEQHTWETDNDFCSWGERRDNA